MSDQRLPVEARDQDLTFDPATPSPLIQRGVARLERRSNSGTATTELATARRPWVDLNGPDPLQGFSTVLYWGCHGFHCFGDVFEWLARGWTTGVLLHHIISDTARRRLIVGPEAALPASASSHSGVADFSLDAIAEHPSSISVLHGDDEPVIACGVVGGVRQGRDLIFGLQERNCSGIAGIGWLRAIDDAQTRMMTFLFPVRGQRGATITTGGGIEDVALLPELHRAVSDHLTEPAYLLATASLGGRSGEVTTDDNLGPDSALPVYSSVTRLEPSLDQLLADPHTVVVRDSSGSIAASGAVGGYREDNILYFGLAERNRSNLSGIAWFSTNDQGHNLLTLFLARGLAGTDLTPA